MASMQRRAFQAAFSALATLGAATGSPGARAQARSLTVAAASDLRFALDDVLPAFRAASAGARIEVVYGATGKLTAQVRNGAPFDVFLAADRSFVQALHRDGLAEAPRLYALGHLVAWSADAALGRLPLAQLVRDARVNRFAIANPEHAPYGRRAMEALRSQGLLDVVQPRLVVGENIAQAAQFVQTGAAQAGLVALSLVLSPALAGQGAYTRVPEAWHSRLEQALVVTRRAKDNALAHAFVAHLESPAARATLRRYGFAMPGEALR
jgi:molybdate transport system substrate-binding protein